METPSARSARRNRGIPPPLSGCFMRFYFVLQTFNRFLWVRFAFASVRLFCVFRAFVVGCLLVLFGLFRFVFCRCCVLFAVRVCVVLFRLFGSVSVGFAVCVRSILFRCCCLSPLLSRFRHRRTQKGIAIAIPFVLLLCVALFKRAKSVISRAFRRSWEFVPCESIKPQNRLFWNDSKYIAIR